MGWSQDTKLFLAVVAGVLATSAFYLALLFVQIENADRACESPQSTVPGLETEDIRDIGFESSFLNLGGRCEYRMDDGSVVVTREPGWGFSATIVGFVVMVAGVVVEFARRKGHPGLLYGLTTLVAPPLGLALLLAAPRRTRSGAAS